MGIKKFRPMTPGTRTRSILDNEVLTRKGPEKSLTESMSSSGGRNHHGRITTRRRGGGHKRRYRVVDFKRNKFDVPGTVAHIEYDPNRSANIALIHYADGEKRYVIHPKGLSIGDTITSGPDADVRVGCAMPMELIPLGTTIHCIELKPEKGAQMARSAGTSQGCSPRSARASSRCGAAHRLAARRRARLRGGTTGTKPYRTRYWPGELCWLWESRC